ncbi:MAG: hypothetical protein KGJ93_00700 [Patescibacteria group bacterium]|nr:hypothetical protein [Patescibacteria group bacterium]
MEKREKWLHAIVIAQRDYNGVRKGARGWVMGVTAKSEMLIMFEQSSMFGSNRRACNVASELADELLKITGISHTDPFLPHAGGIQAIGGF